MDELHVRVPVSRKTNEYSQGRESLMEHCIEIAAEMKQKIIDREEDRIYEVRHSSLCQFPCLLMGST